jgi:predicted CoA-binding protein
VDGVVIATHPDASLNVVRQCVEAGIPRVWIHRSFGQGSMSDEAVTEARAAGLSVIPGACPMMFCEPVDIGHKCFRWWFGMRGKLPRVPGSTPREA